MKELLQFCHSMSKRRYALGVLLLLINGVVFYNAWRHHPLVGYDGHDHAAYLLTLGNGRLPTPTDTYEFFSPPLPYLLPALGLWLGWLEASAAFRLTLLLNGLLSVGVTLTYVAIARQLCPQRPGFALGALALLGMLPVYYKSFAFIRGEPYVLFFGLLLIQALLQPVPASEIKQVRRAAWLGLLLGCAILSRQWAFFFFPVVGLHVVLAWWQQRQRHTPTWRQRDYRLGLVARPQTRPWHYGLLTAVVAVLVGGWFYLHLYQSYGSITTFNRDPALGFALGNHPQTFYLGLGDGYLFTDPVRPHFASQLLPKFYSELWGDHEAYFVVVGQDGSNGRYLPGWQLEAALGQPWLVTNRTEMGAYLGRVNRVALLPTAVLLSGFLFGLWQTAKQLRHWQQKPLQPSVTLWLTVALSISGYLWFLIQYPNAEKGDTIKATDLLHIFPLLTLLSAIALERLPLPLRRILWVGLGTTTLYFLPLFFTHYNI